ncbi:alpha/beta fold hydrolase [Algiphilus aromaticivorans]|uniref:alpha/beta fold hydrolase n=1 Tax=Algiphilus aromaticivorans TaxID=382454 RepID=UPI0006947F4C|nr:alpha/beta hydrolase [Algiphilus aromaticivorans]
MKPARIDALLYGTLAGRRERVAAGWPEGMRWVPTTSGTIRVLDGGGDGHPVVFAPDGPCVIEHYAALRALLEPDFRVIVFDLPGFGFSAPPADYGHRLSEGARVVAGLLESLALPPVTLVMSCVNGFYAMAATRLARARIARLVLCQTPSLAAMQRWTERMVPSPITTPVLGQLLSFFSRRRIATGWYRVAVADREQQAVFSRTARTALRQGGCYCFAGVVQGMLATDAADPQLQPPPDLPVTMVWGKADRSHKRTDPASLRAHCPQAEIVPIADAGHFPELEAPEAFAALLRRRCLPA